MKVGAVFFWRIWGGLLILFLRAVANIPTQNLVFAMTLISQDDHHTTGAWAACRSTIKLVERLAFTKVSQNCKGQI